MRIFISHPYADNPETNKEKAEKICRDLVKEGHLPLSPLHLFSFMDNDDYRNDIIRTCFELIQISDEVWVYGDSRGCNEERRYAEFIGRPVKIKY